MKNFLFLILALSVSALAADMPKSDYETVAAGASDQVLGPVGAAGDVIERLIIIPGTTSPGEVLIKDGGGSAISVFKGGATSVADLKTIVIDLGARSTAGAWKVTTGTNVTAIGVGRFK